MITLTFLLSRRIGLRIVEQILRDVQAPHLISPIDHETWQSWTQNKALYSEVQQRYTGDVALPSPDFRRQHATRPKQNRGELLKMQNWDNAINNLPENPTGVNPFQDIRRVIAVNPEQRGQTIIKASRDRKHWLDNMHWQWAQPNRTVSMSPIKLCPLFSVQSRIERYSQFWGSVPKFTEEVQRTGSTQFKTLESSLYAVKRIDNTLPFKRPSPCSYINKESDELPVKRPPCKV